MTAEKIRVSMPIIVEGKYDKIKLESILDAVIIKTDGFRIYKDKEKCALIRALYNKSGLIVLTDSDNAGFQLRRYIRNIVGASQNKLNQTSLVELYIPQIEGKEARKATFGKEKLLGVEGIDIELLRNMFKAFNSPKPPKLDLITKLDFYEDGLTGGENSAKKREALLKRLNLPLYITTNALLEVINSLLTREEYIKMVRPKKF